LGFIQEEKALPDRVSLDHLLTQPGRPAIGIILKFIPRDLAAKYLPGVLCPST
jgi:hypothetical protein